MLFLLLKIYTTIHIIVMDTNQSPIDSTEKFQPCYELFLYDMIINCTQVNTPHVCMLSIVKSVLQFVEVNKSVLDSKTLVASVKYLVSNYVLANTETGKFQFEMLDLESAFDRDFIFHCNVLSKYDMEDISNSINYFGGCDYKKSYRINRSFSYVDIAICNHIYKMYKLQVKQNRLDRSENYYFQEYYRLVAKDTNYPGWSSDVDNIEIVTCHFVFTDIFTVNLTKFEMEKWLLDHKSKTTHLHFYYSILEIYHALENFRAKMSKKRRTSKKKFYNVKAYDMILNDLNIKYIQDVRIMAWNKRIIKSYSRLQRDPTMYEGYYYEIPRIIKIKKCTQWYKKYKLYVECVIASKHLFANIWNKFKELTLKK